MHPAWQIDDIKQLIVECLSPQDLARLAQTSKGLFDFAINELWKTVTSFYSFLFCLPPDFKRRPLQVEDIQRLDFYASKVRNLVLESKTQRVLIRLPPQFQPLKKNKKIPMNDHYHSPDEKSWEELWKEIEKLRPTSEFLPNLRRLRISNVDEELLIPLVGISASNLIQIYIKYIQNRKSSSIVQKILDRLQSTPKLEYLFVRDGEPDLVPSKLIKQSPVLKHLRLDPRIHMRSRQDFRFKEFPLRTEILRKSTLENLTLGLTKEWYTPEIEVVLKGSKYFPKLKTLWLDLTPFRCINSSMSDNNGLQSKLSNLNLNNTKTTNCGRRSPSFFLKGLDNPELSLLNIKFPIGTRGPLFLDVVSAANKNCRLQKLSELALAGGGWFNYCPECGERLPPRIKPAELREALNLLLPLPHLKLLRLSVTPNFLDILDLDLYKSMTDGLPALETLWFGHGEFVESSEFGGTTYYERVPLHHLAAFCSFLPNLVEVSIGTIDGLALEKNPRQEWICPSVKSLKIRSWAGRDTAIITGSVSRDFLHRGLRTYFPNSDLAKEEFDPRLWFFSRD